MATYVKYPCCGCDIENGSLLKMESMEFSPVVENILKIGEVRVKGFISITLRLLLLQINQNLLNFKFIEGSRVNLAHRDREKTMIRSVYFLLKHMFNKDPSKVDIENVKHVDDICFILKENLEKIVKIHNEALENAYEIYRGKATYQRLVLDILFYTVKFTSQCVDKYEKADKVKIFRDVVDTVEKSFHSSGIVTWIAHSIQKMDPFGKVPT